MAISQSVAALTSRSLFGSVIAPWAAAEQVILIDEPDERVRVEQDSHSM
jgi:hypothetical protein